MWSTTGNNAGNAGATSNERWCMDNGCIGAHGHTEHDCAPPTGSATSRLLPSSGLYIMPMANLLRSYIRGQEAPILRGKDGNYV